MLPSVSNLQPILHTRFRRKSDRLFVMAQMYSPRSTATGGLELPFRICRAGPKSIIKAGDVLLGSKGQKYLLAYVGTEEDGSYGATVYKAVELTKTGVVYRTTDVLDPNTKRTNKSLTSAGWIDYAQEPRRQNEDTGRIQYDTYEIYTDYPLKVGDNIDKNKVVEQAEIRLGVTWARMRDA
jgi:hypothetical protein